MSSISEQSLHAFSCAFPFLGSGKISAGGNNVYSNIAAVRKARNAAKSNIARSNIDILYTLGKIYGESTSAKFIPLKYAKHQHFYQLHQ